MDKIHKAAIAVIIKTFTAVAASAFAIASTFTSRVGLGHIKVFIIIITTRYLRPGLIIFIM